jgi:hypothetical protein
MSPAYTVLPNAPPDNITKIDSNLHQ